MVKCTVVKEEKFKPVVLQIEILDQETLDKLGSIFNHNKICRIFSDEDDVCSVIRTALLSCNANVSKHLFDINNSFSYK